MGGFLEGLGMQAAGQAVSFGIEQAGNAINAKRNYKYQKKINKQNAELAFDLWSKTYDASSPEVQMERLKAAGLNPGLMYGGSGVGGATQPTAQTGSGSGTGNQSNSAAMSGMGLMAGQQKAVIENIKAQTQKTNAETEKITGADTKKVIAETGNLELDNKIKEVEARIAASTEEMRKETPELLNRRMNQEIEQIVAETRKAEAEGKIAQETADDAIKQMRARTIEQSLRIALQKADVIKTGAETDEVKAKIEKIGAEIVRMQEQTKQGETGLSQEAEKIILQQIQTEFQTGDSAETLRWINAVGGIGTNLFKKATMKTKSKDFPTKKPSWMSQKQWEHVNNND